MNSTYYRIEKLCSLNDIDITTLCRNAKISRASLSEFKAGRTRKLSTDTLKKIADYFDVSVDYLLTGDSGLINGSNRNIEEYVSLLQTRPEMRNYLDLAKSATREEVETATKILEAYFNSIR